MKNDLERRREVKEGQEKKREVAKSVEGVRVKERERGRRNMGLKASNSKDGPLAAAKDQHGRRVELKPGIAVKSKMMRRDISSINLVTHYRAGTRSFPSWERAPSGRW